MFAITAPVAPATAPPQGGRVNSFDCTAMIVDYDESQPQNSSSIVVFGDILDCDQPRTSGPAGMYRRSRQMESQKVTGQRIEPQNFSYHSHYVQGDHQFMQRKKGYFPEKRSR
jgi:hypothetical protein